ncbi:MAG: hypothetical protein AB7O78_03700 [Thermoleophilia bacterium]
MSVESLIAAARLERVPTDRAGAGRRLDAAERHLRSAEAILDEDPDGAYAMLWDAARKAVTAHMLAAGLRVRNAPGAHAAVAEYAAAELTVEAAAELDRMRRFRNRIEYGSTSFTPRQVRHDLQNARAVVQAIRKALDR